MMPWRVGASVGKKALRSRGPIFALVSQLVSSVGYFISAMIISRAAGIELLGQFGLCFLILMLVRNFQIGLLLTPLSTLAPKLPLPLAPMYRGFLLIQLAIFLLASSLTILGFAILFGDFVGPGWFNDSIGMLVTAAACGSVADYLRRYHFVWSSPFRAFRVDVLRTSVQVGLLLIGVSNGLLADHGLWFALATVAAGGAAGALVGIAGHGRPAHSRRLNGVAWARHWNFIRWMGPAVTLDNVQASAPLFLVSGVLGEAAVGVVRGMQAVGNMVNLPLNALQHIAPSIASREYHRGGGEALHRFILKLVKAASLLSAIILGCAVVIGPLVIEQGFRIRASDALLILMLQIVANGLALGKFVLSLELSSREVVAPNAYAAAFGALAALTFTIPLARQLGPAAVPVVAIGLNGIWIAVFAIAIKRARRSDTRQPARKTAFRAID